MSNNDRINEAIAILQTMNMEDCAQEIDNLRHELERVKGIAGRRLDRIAQLQHNVAVLEDKLEDTRSDLRSSFEHTTQLLGQMRARISELEIERDLAMIYEHDELGREPRTHLELGL